MSSTTHWPPMEVGQPQWLHWGPDQWFGEPDDPALMNYAASHSLIRTNRKRGDRMQAPRGLQANFNRMVKFYRSKGLDVVGYDDVHWDMGAIQTLPKGYRYAPLAYNNSTAPENYRRTAQAQAWNDIMSLIRDKNLFQTWCEQNGFGDKVPATFMFEEGQRPTRRQLARLGSHFWLKGSLEIWGKHPVFECKSLADFEAALAQIVGPYQLQEHRAGKPYNIAYELFSSGVVCRGSSLQRMKPATPGGPPVVHAGNHRTDEHRNVAQPTTDDMVEKLRSLGLLGRIGLDVQAQGDTEDSAIDGNFRVNGVHAPAETADDLGYDDFYAGFVDGEDGQTLDGLITAIEALELPPGDLVLPVVWGTFDHDQHASVLALSRDGDPRDLFDWAVPALNLR